MVRYITEFRVPNKVNHISGVKLEDGGQAAICDYPLDERVIEGEDDCFFVRLQSWNEAAANRERGEDLLQFHPLLKSLMGKRVRVTIEEI
jgi:hypothetical protein